MKHIHFINIQRIRDGDEIMLVKGYKDGVWYYQNIDDFRAMIVFIAMVEWYEYIS